MITYDNIQKIATGQGDDILISNYTYFKKHCKMIAIDLRKQHALDADPKVIQQINFIGYLHVGGDITMFSITEELKETFLDFSQRIVREL